MRFANHFILFLNYISLIVYKAFMGFSGFGLYCKSINITLNLYWSLGQIYNDTVTAAKVFLQIPAQLYNPSIIMSQ